MLVNFSGFIPSGPCPYLPGLEWAQDVLLVRSMTPDEYVALLDQGYRRAGRHVYRPRCAACRECRPLRVPVGCFAPSRTQKRIWRLNRDLAVTLGRPQVDAVRLELHNRYVTERHDHEPSDPSGYRQFFVDSPVPTREISYRLDGRLVGIAILDELGPVCSAVYTYFDPSLPRRSLGTFSILWEIEHARRTGAEWLHLGFHVLGSKTMTYKANFRPCEKLSVEGRWEPYRGE